MRNEVSDHLIATELYESIHKDKLAYFLLLSLDMSSNYKK